MKGSGQGRCGATCRRAPRGDGSLLFRPLTTDERWQFYRVDVPAAAATLDVTLDATAHDGSGNLDLYLWQNARPGAAPPQCRASSPGALRETCSITANAPGTWWAGVHRAGKDSTNYSITARWQ